MVSYITFKDTINTHNGKKYFLEYNRSSALGYKRKHYITK